MESSSSSSSDSSQSPEMAVVPRRRIPANQREEEEVEKGIQKADYGFLTKLYNFFSSSENDYGEISSSGGIVFESEAKLKEFKNSFKTEAKDSIKLAKNYKAFTAQLRTYNFRRAEPKDPPWYHNSHFTLVNPNLDLINTDKYKSSKNKKPSIKTKQLVKAPIKKKNKSPVKKKQIVKTIVEHKKKRPDKTKKLLKTIDKKKQQLCRTNSETYKKNCKTNSEITENPYDAKQRASVPLSSEHRFLLKLIQGLKDENQRLEDRVVEIRDGQLKLKSGIAEAEKLVELLTKGHNAGLRNLGNTCYVNSSLQCLYAVPELVFKLAMYHGSDPLTVATRDLFAQLDRSKTPVSPKQFWAELRKIHPDYGLKEGGKFKQQDAEECRVILLNALSKSLGAEDGSEDSEFVKKLFEIQLISSVTCPRTDETSSETEILHLLMCYIPAGVKHLLEGLKLSFRTEEDKFSVSLQRNCLHVTESRISVLPRYLIVQFERFSFSIKKLGSTDKNKQVIDFPFVLDVYDLCSDDLRQQLEGLRQLDVVSNMSVISKGKEGRPTGIYDLVYILVHQGKTGNYGHYVSWVKQVNGTWIEYDDHIPTEQSEADVKKLYGGREGVTAYVCMYRASVC